MFGKEVRRLRISAGQSVRDLARDVGVTAGFISQVENYDDVPSPECIIELAVQLKASPERLLDLAKQTKLQRVESKLTEEYAAALANRFPGNAKPLPPAAGTDRRSAC